MEGQEKAKEQLENIPRLFKGISWKEAIEIGSKASFVLVSVCYISGLLILNLHLRQYGIFYLNFLQADYIMVGALWLFLCGSMYCFYYQVILPNKPDFKEWTTFKKKLLGIFKLLGALLDLVRSKNDGGLGLATRPPVTQATACPSRSCVLKFVNPHTVRLT